MKPSFELKRNQLLLAIGVGLGFLSLSGIGFYFLGRGTASVVSSSHPKSTSIETAVTKIDPHEVWRIRLEDTMAATSQKVALMEKMLGENLTSLTKEPQDSEVEALRQELEILKEQVTMSRVTMSGVTTSQPTADSQETMVNPFASSEALTGHPGTRVASGTSPRIGKLIFNLKEAPSNGLKKTTDTTIPAGSFVKAVLLGGVDASTSIQASSDPRPVLLRLRDPGTLPRKLKSDLKNCHILVSSYGDLSSERVYMRLEKLTCTEPITHEISEMTVSGYVAGEDGKAGLRGVVVDKTGPLLRSIAKST